MKRLDFRAATSTAILDFVDSLPRFQGGVIGRLQLVRVHQRQSAREFYEGSRPPKGTSYNFAEFCAIEIFLDTETDKLEKRINRLFPNEKKNKKLLADISNRRGRIHAGSWNRLGIISSQTAFSSIRVRQDPTLPSFIDYCEVSLYQTIPSLYCLAYRFHLLPAIGQSIAAAQCRHYLPKVSFNRFTSLSRFAGSFTQFPARTSMQEAVLRCIEEPRARCIDWIHKKSFSGPLGLRSLDSPGRFRHFDVVRLTGDLPTADEEANWLQSNRNWLDSLGIKLGISEDFRGEFSTFVFGSQTASTKSSFPKIIQRHSDQETELEFVVDGIAIFEMFCGLLDCIQNSAEILRPVLSSSSKTASGQLRGKYVSSTMSAHSNSLNLDRLRTEIKQHKDVILHELGSLAAFGSGTPRSETPDLRSRMMGIIEWKIEVISPHVAQIDSAFSRYISFQSAVATYRLQKQIFWLSIVLLIFAGIGILAEWDSIVKTWNALM